MQRKTPSFQGLWLVVFGIVLSIASPASAALIMRIDSANKFFSIDGSDTGNGFDFGFGSYDLQFYYGFSTQPSANTTITNTPQNLFVQGATLPIQFGGMNMIRGNPSPSYVFIDLSATSDITTLTGKGPTETVSYAGLPAADQTLFESMIGQTMSLTIGTGYSPLRVEPVPEPTTVTLLAAVVLGGVWQTRRTRRR